MSVHAMAVETAVETYDWVDTTNLSILVANFARIHMLLSLFDGDPDKWIDFLMSSGTAEERQNDLPFAEELKRRMAEDPHHVDRLRTLVHDFSMMV
jgi:hypothetical protein